MDDGTASLYVLEMSTTLVVDVLGVQKNKECYRNLNFQKVLSQPAKQAAVWGAGGGNSRGLHWEGFKACGKVKVDQENVLH